VDGPVPPANKNTCKKCFWAYNGESYGKDVGEGQTVKLVVKAGVIGGHSLDAGGRRERKKIERGKGGTGESRKQCARIGTWKEAK